MWKSEFRQNYRTISRPQFHLSLLGSVASLRTYKHLATKVGTSKGGESNGKLPPRTCPGCSVPEPHRSQDWALFLPTRPLRLNTNEWMNEWMNIYIYITQYYIDPTRFDVICTILRELHMKIWNLLKYTILHKWFVKHYNVFAASVNRVHFGNIQTYIFVFAKGAVEGVIN